jgi:phage terminase large subunit
MNQTIRINEKFRPLIKDKNRFLIIYGGAGSGKSVFTAQAKILLKCLQETGHTFLIIRKVAKTIRYSVWSLIVSLIKEYWLEQLFKINKTEFRISCVNGNEILFLGLDDVEKLKSIHGITVIWIEESSEISEDDLKQCNLRLRGKTKVKKQIILTFNPISHIHWLKKYFFDTKQNNCTIHKSTYKDNAHIDDEYKQQLEQLKEIDNTFYQIYALGEWGIIGNLIFTNYVIEDFDYEEEDFDDVYYGADFGFNDPSALIKVGFKDDEIYIFDEVYQTKLTNTDLIDKANGFFGNKIITADSAEPDRIMEFRRAGHNMRAAKKGKDSVKHGIDFLKRYRIHIHKSKCNNTANEIQLYKNKEDKEGNILDEPVGFNDHAIAAIRYAIEPLRLQRQVGVSDIPAGYLGL